MHDLYEAIRLLNKLDSKEPEVIKITVIVNKDDSIEERLPSGNKDEVYDDQTLEDWYDFANTIECTIDNFCDIVNMSISKNPNSLSEYIDFYVYDENGNKKDYLVDLRLSDHKATTNARELRKKNAHKLDSNPGFVTVLVNDKQFDSYDQAINYIRSTLARKSFTTS